MTNLYHVGYYRVTDLVNGGTLGVGYFVSELIPSGGRLVFSPIEDRSAGATEVERLRARVIALESAALDIGGTQDSPSALRAVQLVADLKQQLADATTQLESLRTAQTEQAQRCFQALGYDPAALPPVISQAADPLVMACMVFRKQHPPKPRKAT